MKALIIEPGCGIEELLRLEAEYDHLCPTGQRKVALHHWRDIYAARMRRVSIRKLGEQYGCSPDWISEIVRRCSIADGTYNPEEYHRQRRQDLADMRANFRGRKQRTHDARVVEAENARRVLGVRQSTEAGRPITRHLEEIPRSYDSMHPTEQQWVEDPPRERRVKHRTGTWRRNVFPQS